LTGGHHVFSCYKEHKPAYGNPTLLDQTNERQVRQAISEIQPEAIINTAAVTDVDQCEENGNIASLVNATSVSYVANSARECEAFLVQVSTDYVFDGERGGYSESDSPNPINKYGLSKLEGEQAATAAGDGNVCIARTSVVYGWGRPQRPNAATYVYDRLSKHEKISMVRDQFSSPTLNTNLAHMLVEIAERRLPGTIHVAGATRLNRFDFAVGLAENLGLDESLIQPISVSDMKWKAKRPRDSSLDVTKALRVLAHKPYSIDRAYTEFQKEARPPAPRQT
jgi:dTDP-4-dehydrorhamnose reductase